MVLRFLTAGHAVRSQRVRLPIALLVFFLFMANGCSLRRSGAKKYTLNWFGMSGVYHPVKKGETLWRISKVYGVDIERIVRYNRINAHEDIMVGQKLFIPGAKKIKKIQVAKPTALSKKKTTTRRSLPAPANIRAPARLEIIWPVKGQITSRYGDNGNTHFGIDIATRQDTPIRAAAAGRVSYVGYNPLTYGNFIILEHEDGYVTVYAHNAKNIVKVGRKVKQGQVIAYVGSTGNSTGNHLHFEIRLRRKTRNPLWYLPPRSGR